MRRGGEMVYARALRALECIIHAGSSPVLGTRRRQEISAAFSL